MSIRRKINLTLATGFGLTLLLAGTGIWVSWRASSNLSQIVGEYAEAKTLALEASQLATSALSNQRAMIVRIVQSDRGGMERYERQYRADQTALQQKLSALRALPTRSGRNTAIDEAQNLVKTWDRLHSRLGELAQKGDGAEMAKLCSSEIMPLAQRVSAQVGQLVQEERTAMARASEDSLGELSVQTWVAVAIGIISLALLLVGLWATRQGLTDLSTALLDLRRMADEVTQASGSLSSTSQALADGATRQAVSTEETAASSTDVKTMAQRNSDSAKQAATIVTIAQEKFDQANRSMAKLEETMAGIGASASKIARIIKVIDDIAFQTNILSLNAAVEAARAGDAGMGFAVVADEVRGLAQRCATAAQETAELINESITKAAEGKAAAGEVAGTIRSVTEETESIRALVTEVSEGSEGQARAMDEIATAVSQIERVTQDCAANAEEAAAASEELTAQASELRHIMERITDLAGVGAEAVNPLAPSSSPAPRNAQSAAPSSWSKPAAHSPQPSNASGTSSRSQAPASLLASDDDDQNFRPF